MKYEKFLTVKEAASILRIHTITLYEYIKLGKLHALKLGRNYRIAEEEFNKFIKEFSI